MITLSKMQQHWLDSFKMQHESSQIAVIGGDRMTGKTYLAVWLILSAQPNSKTSYLGYNQRLLRTVLHLITDHTIPNKVYRATNEIVLENGAYVKLASDEDFLRGNRFDTMIFDNGHLISNVMRHLINQHQPKAYVLL